MAAAAFKVSLNVRTKSGMKSFYLSATDVNAAALTFPSGATELPLDSDNCVITDFICAPTYGTDTTNMTLYVGGIDSGYRIINAANQSGTINRQVAMNPIGVKGGVPVKFIQNT